MMPVDLLRFCAKIITYKNREIFNVKNNRRAHTRHRVLINSHGCSKSGNKNIGADIRDISSRGIGITTDEQLVPGDVIELEITIPGDGIPMFIVGEVAWASAQPDANGIYNAGLRLTRIHDCDRERLVRYIGSSFSR